MKKIISAILAIMMIATLSISAFAANQQLYIDELELELTISDEYDVITMDTPADDPIFAKIGITKAEFDAYAESVGICFNALEKNWEDEVYIAMTELTDPTIVGRDFSELEYSEIEEIYANIKGAVESNNGTISAYEIYQPGQVKFMKIYKNFAMDDIFDLTFYTIVGDKEYSISLSSYLGEVTAEQEATLIEFVNNVKFDNVFEAPVVTEPVIEETEPVTYDYFEETEPYIEGETDTVGADDGSSDAFGFLGVIGALGVAGIVGIILLIAAIFILPVIIVIIIIVVVVKKKKKKKAMEAANAENSENITKTE